MMAASYWSLLAPSIEMAEQSGEYGDYAFLPAAIGFLIGSLFVCATDVLITVFGLQSASVMLGKSSVCHFHYNTDLTGTCFFDYNKVNVYRQDTP